VGHFSLARLHMHPKIVRPPRVDERYLFSYLIISLHVVVWGIAYRPPPLLLGMPCRGPTGGLAVQQQSTAGVIGAHSLLKSASS
jgi:hypothetical protein